MAESEKSDESPAKAKEDKPKKCVGFSEEVTTIEAPSELHSEKHSMQSTSQWLQQYMAHSLGIAVAPEKLLPSLDLSGVARYMSSDKCKNIITMAGAGISTSAGIPDFRSRNTGIYEKMKLRDDFDMPSPESITNIDYFKKNPIPFYHMAKDMFPGNFKPTPCHYFLRLLNEKGKVLRHYTQNIDTLEDLAGFPAEKMVEAHGSFRVGYCLECGEEYSQAWMKERLFSDKIPLICEEDGCEGYVKPDIVFFGEALPSRFAECAEEDLPKCDLVIVMGTALRVPPFSSLVIKVPLTTPRLYVNLEKGEWDVHPITALFFGKPDFAFEREDNYRDVFHQSTTDDAAYELADLLGWGDELRRLVKSEHARLDKVKATAGQTQATGRTDKTPASSTSTQPKSKTTTTTVAAKTKTTEEKPAHAHSHAKKETSQASPKEEASGKVKGQGAVPRQTVRSGTPSGASRKPASTARKSTTAKK